MENNNKLKNKKIETFAQDMVKAIEDDRGGLIKKIIHEDEERQARKKNLSPKSKKNKFFLFISFFLLLLTFALLISLFFLNKNINTISIPTQYASMIFTDQTSFMEIDGLTRDKIVEDILKEVNISKVKIGAVEGIYLTENKKVVDLKRFISLINGSLVLNQDGIISSSFLLGAFKSGLSPASPSLGGSISPNTGDFFLLFKVRSFIDAFPIMRTWENKMLYDLNDFFDVQITPETNYLFTKDWEEGVFGNKNARILRDNNGKIVLMYVFADNNSIIVTNSENAVNEVILRLSSSQIKK